MKKSITEINNDIQRLLLQEAQLKDRVKKLKLQAKTQKKKQLTLHEQIGLNIRDARKAQKMSSEQLGELCNLTRASIINIESGRQKCSIENLYKFASALSVHVTALLV